MRKPHIIATGGKNSSGAVKRFNEEPLSTKALLMWCKTKRSIGA